MPSALQIDWNDVDLDVVLYDREAIYQRMPQSFEFEMLDAVCQLDRESGLAVAYLDCRTDAWWVRGHVPGNPIFPGVLQLEAAAQLTAFMTRYVDGEPGFIAFGGVENCRFRGVVKPPSRFVLTARIIENRTRRVRSSTQGVIDGKLVFEAEIIGMPLSSP